MTGHSLLHLMWLGWMIVIASGEIKQKSTDIQHSASDSAQLEIHEIYDEGGLLEQYRVRVYTPICETDKCYEVELEFFCDPIGRFLRYDTLRGKELTKLDHIPFREIDYHKLQEILSNQNSILANYAKDELVSDTRVSEIDGFTGATILEVKESVIEGAVYSCYTLWHLAHGALVDSLRQRTAKDFTAALVDKLVDLNRQDVNYFLIEHLSENQFQEFLPQVLQTIENGQGYYPKNALERMPGSAVNSAMAQEFFARHFPELDYFTQVALLKQLDQEQLAESLSRVLEQSLGERGSLRDQLIKGLISP